MVSQYNVWNLDDGNLPDDYRTVLEDLKRTPASADEYRLSLEKNKYYVIFLVSKAQKKESKRILTNFARLLKWRIVRIWNV